MRPPFHNCTTTPYDEPSFRPFVVPVAGRLLINTFMFHRGTDALILYSVSSRSQYMPGYCGRRGFHGFAHPVRSVPWNMPWPSPSKSLLIHHSWPYPYLIQCSESTRLEGCTLGSTLTSQRCSSRHVTGADISRATGRITFQNRTRDNSVSQVIVALSGPKFRSIVGEKREKHGPVFKACVAHARA